MSKKILVIDDEYHIGNLIAFIMNKSGYRVDLVMQAQQGLDVAKQGEFHLIILDMMMPHKDGFTVMQELRNDQKTKDTPIIMLSSAHQFEKKMQSVEDQKVAYLSKPFNKQELVDLVKSHLEKHAI